MGQVGDRIVEGIDMGGGSIFSKEKMREECGEDLREEVLGEGGADIEM